MCGLIAHLLSCSTVTSGVSEYTVEILPVKCYQNLDGVSLSEVWSYKYFVSSESCAAFVDLLLIDWSNTCYYTTTSITCTHL